MADEKPVDKSAPSSSSASPRPPAGQAADKGLKDIFEKARQTVKPIINREASNETVTEDLLNFRMK